MCPRNYKVLCIHPRSGDFRQQRSFVTLSVSEGSLFNVLAWSLTMQATRAHAQIRGLFRETCLQRLCASKVINLTKQTLRMRGKLCAPLLAQQRAGFTYQVVFHQHALRHQSPTKASPLSSSES